jgi:hypothetical protein
MLIWHFFRDGVPLNTVHANIKQYKGEDLTFVILSCAALARLRVPRPPALSSFFSCLSEKRLSMVWWRHSQSSLLSPKRGHAAHFFRLETAAAYQRQILCSFQHTDWYKKNISYLKNIVRRVQKMLAYMTYCSKKCRLFHREFKGGNNLVLCKNIKLLCRPSGITCNKYRYAVLCFEESFLCDAYRLIDKRCRKVP